MNATSEPTPSAKLVIVEDNYELAEIYQRRMQILGYECQVAHEGNEALALIEQETPDLVLLDLMLPGLSGDEILSRMRQSDWGRDIKVLIISNVNEDDAPAGLRELGIEDYVVKANLINDQLDRMVDEIIQRTGKSSPA